MTTRATACPHCRNWRLYHATFVCSWCHVRHVAAVVSGATYYTQVLPTVSRPGTFRAEVVKP